jgi:hypothetical protein
VSPDGWIDREASFTFQLAGLSRSTLLITGHIPGTPPNGVSSEQVRVSVNGTTVLEQKVDAGEFTLHIKLKPLEGEVRLNIASDHAFPLLPPDTRSVSLRLESIQWKAENGSN